MLGMVEILLRKRQRRKRKGVKVQRKRKHKIIQFRLFLKMIFDGCHWYRLNIIYLNSSYTCIFCHSSTALLGSACQTTQFYGPDKSVGVYMYIQCIKEPKYINMLATKILLSTGVLKWDYIRCCSPFDHKIGVNQCAAPK